MYSIITMIKLILIAFLSLALSGPVHGHDDEPAECYPGQARIKLSIKVPEGACGCSSDEEEEEEENVCLGMENSKKISDAILYILRNNDDTYDVLTKLSLHKFMYGLDYSDFEDIIKDNDFDLNGFAELKELVEKYRVCKRECKVYFTLRKTLQEEAAYAIIREEENGDGFRTLILDGAEGKLVILGDSIKELQEMIVSDAYINTVTIKAPTIIADVDLLPGIWHGMHIRVEAENFLATAKRSKWDVEKRM